MRERCDDDSNSTRTAVAPRCSTRAVKPGFGVDTTTTTFDADERTVIVPPVDEMVMVVGAAGPRVVGGDGTATGGGPAFATGEVVDVGVAAGAVVGGALVVGTSGRAEALTAVVGGIVAVAPTVAGDGTPTSVVSGAPNRLPLVAREPPVVAAAAGVANAASRRVASRMVPTPLATSSVAAQVAASQDATMVSRRLTPQCDRRRPRCVVTDP